MLDVGHELFFVILSDGYIYIFPEENPETGNFGNLMQIDNVGTVYTHEMRGKQG